MNAMKKILAVLGVLAFMAFGSAPGVFAKGVDRSMDSEPRDLIGDLKDSNAWIGKDVMNLEGEVLGDIKEFVRDESGAIVLAIVSHDEKNVAVPYSALSFDESEDHAVLDATMDQLANAPEIEAEENLSGRAAVEEVYRHFGERPYWSEQGGAADLQPYEYSGADEGMNEGPDADREIDTRGGAGFDHGMESYYP